MNTYKNLKLIIKHTNDQYNSEEITSEEYNSFKEDALKKMDTFLLCNRFSAEKYEELFAMFVDIDVESAGAEATA